MAVSVTVEFSHNKCGMQFILVFIVDIVMDIVDIRVKMVDKGVDNVVNIV